MRAPACFSLSVHTNSSTYPEQWGKQGANLIRTWKTKQWKSFSLSASRTPAFISTPLLNVSLPYCNCRQFHTCIKSRPWRSERGRREKKNNVWLVRFVLKANNCLMPVLCLTLRKRRTVNNNTKRGTQSNLMATQSKSYFAFCHQFFRFARKWWWWCSLVMLTNDRNVFCISLLSRCNLFSQILNLSL